MRHLQLRFDNGECEEISLFGGRAVNVSIKEDKDDTQIVYAEHSIAFYLSSSSTCQVFVFPSAAARELFADALRGSGCIMRDLTNQVGFIG